MVVFLVAAFACSDSVDPYSPPDQFTEKEKELIGLWNYRFIRVKDFASEFYKASMSMEPNTESSKRADLDNRLVYFSKDKTYQLRWKDRGFYELGTKGDPNWQPSFGYWELNSSEDSLIFNRGQYYEKRFKIVTLDNSQLTRESDRFMSSTFSHPNFPSWSRGDWIKYKEYFIKVGY